MPHEILTNTPGYQQIADRRAKLRKAERKHQDRTAAVAAEQQRLRKQHQVDYDDAVLNALDPPPEPVLPKADPRAAELLLAEGLRIDTDEQTLLARNIGLIEEQAAAIEADRLGEARKLVRLLKNYGDELKDLSVLVRAARKAAGTGPDPAGDTCSVADIVRAVETSTGFLNPGAERSTVTYSAPSQEVARDEDVADWDFSGLGGKPQRSPRRYRTYPGRR